MLDSKSVKEGYRAVRGIFQPDGARRAEAQMRETRDQIRERLRRAYISETRKHIATLFTELGIENKSVAAVRSLADGISAMLDREQDYVTKLAEWRQVELKIERARRQATNAHEREELEAMQAETREIAAEAQRHAELLSLALGSGDETCTTAE
jgi:hypothetical protein